MIVASFKSVSGNGMLAKTYIFKKDNIVNINRILLSDKELKGYETVRKFWDKYLLFESMKFKEDSFKTIIKAYINL